MFMTVSGGLLADGAPRLSRRTGTVVALRWAMVAKIGAAMAVWLRRSLEAIR